MAMNKSQMYALCMSLKNTSRTTEKKELLREWESNEDFRELLRFLLDPMVVTGLDKAKLNKVITGQTATQTIHTFHELFEYLNANHTGRDIDILNVRTFIADWEPRPEIDNFLEELVAKTLKLGVDVKSVNAVYGSNFIPVHEVQLGSPQDKLKLAVGEKFFLTQKLNGVRGSYVGDSLISRQGQKFQGLEHITKALEPYRHAYFIDGELILKNPPGPDQRSDNENFRIGTGLISADSGDKSQIEFVVFDMFPLSEYQRVKGSVAKYSARRKLLDDLSTDLAARNVNCVRVTPLLYEGTDQTQITTWLAYADSHNWEGCMLNKDAPYVCKRTSNLIKIKTFHHSDLKVVGYEEGSGRNTGTLGALIVEYKGNTVNVGSGFTDADRAAIWANPDAMIGKIIQVKYKEESTDSKTGAVSLQFPVFECIREDKNEESIE